MASERSKKYLQDISDAIQNVETSTLGLGPKEYETYEVSWIVERGIEIIAEAIKRLAVTEPALQVSHGSKIIATRNKITHEYDVIDSFQLYVIVTKYLPLLKSEVQNHIDTL